MASQKQIDANRANAQKSTGPTSLDGRNRSRRNAIRDGLTGQITTLSDNDRPFFEKLQSDMLADLKPSNATEHTLASAVIWDTWRLSHLRAVECNLYSLGQAEQEAEKETQPESSAESDLDSAYADARTFRAEARRLDLLSLYEQRMTRNLHRNIHLLRSLQSDRDRKYQSDKAEEVMIARTCEFNNMPIKASTAPSKNGFIFSNEEIAAATVRSRYVDTSLYMLKNRSPSDLYRTLPLGFGDSYLEKTEKEPETRPFSVHPEILALDRLNNPDEYAVKP